MIFRTCDARAIKVRHRRSPFSPGESFAHPPPLSLEFLSKLYSREWDALGSKRAHVDVVGECINEEGNKSQVVRLPCEGMRVHEPCRAMYTRWRSVNILFYGRP